jgi:phosphate acetyltransferase
MRFIGSVIEKLQRHPKRIVFPEGTEPRILQAARQFYSLRLGAPILLGDRTKVKEAAANLNVSLEGVRIINPAESEDLENFAHRYELLRRFKGIKVKEARDAMLNPNYYGAMMVAMHQADGFISGASEFTGSTLRPLFQIIKVAPQATTASSCIAGHSATGRDALLLDQRQRHARHHRTCAGRHGPRPAKGRTEGPRS